MYNLTDFKNSVIRALDCGNNALCHSAIELLSPVTNPDKVVCVGMNYMDHCLEQNVAIPKEPVIFSKFGSSIVGPYSDIIHPTDSNVSTFLFYNLRIS